MISEYRSAYCNIINEYPIGSKDVAESSRFRNLKYIASKAIISSNYPYYKPIYEEASEEIKNGLTDNDIEARVLAIRLARALPFLFRTKLIENCENVSQPLPRKSPTPSSPSIRNRQSRSTIPTGMKSHLISLTSCYRSSSSPPKAKTSTSTSTKGSSLSSAASSKVLSRAIRTVSGTHAKSYGTSFGYSERKPCEPTELRTS